MDITTKSDCGADARFRAAQSDAHTWLITVEGEVDLSNRDHLQAMVDTAVGAGPAKLVFDLAGLRYLDSSGLSVMIAAVRQATEVEIRAASPGIRQLFEISGLTEVFRTER
jgi:anti-sigma B factor antagonist